MGLATLALLAAACAPPTPPPGALETALPATEASGATQVAADFAAQRATLTEPAPTVTAAVPTAAVTPTASGTPAPEDTTTRTETETPARTASTLPILTATTSPHTCRLNVSWVGTEQKLLVVGFDWPPDEIIYLTGYENDTVSGWPHWRVNNQMINQTGNANTDPPFGFSLKLTYQGGRASYALTAGMCTAQFNFP